MFKSVQARFALRCTLYGIGGLLTSLIASTAGSDLTLNEVFIALGSGFGAAMTYAGVGAAFPQVEPSIGKK
jgi:hypothetical protein